MRVALHEMREQLTKVSHELDRLGSVENMEEKNRENPKLLEIRAKVEKMEIKHP